MWKSISTIMSGIFLTDEAIQHILRAKVRRPTALFLSYSYFQYSWLFWHSHQLFSLIYFSLSLTTHTSIASFLLVLLLHTFVPLLARRACSAGASSSLSARVWSSLRGALHRRASSSTASLGSASFSRGSTHPTSCTPPLISVSRQLRPNACATPRCSHGIWCANLFQPCRRHVGAAPSRLRRAPCRCRAYQSPTSSE